METHVAKSPITETQNPVINLEDSEIKDGNVSSDTSSATEPEDNTNLSDKDDVLNNECMENKDGANSDQVTEYVVDARDTLNSIAAKHDTTPALLKQHNKLSSGFVFPGQLLKIPPPEPKKPPEPAKESKKEPVKKASIPEEPEIFDTQFVKVNVKFITEGKGIVSGSLFLTPKNLMFTPSPNDPLVEESKANGDSDGYQIVLPNELIVNIALLLDFNRFKFKDFSSGVTGDDDIDESLVFRGLPSNDSNNEITSETKEQDSVTNKEDETTKTNSDLDTQPVYLRFLIGKPIGEKIPRNAPIMSYGEQALEPQYWFIIPSLRKADSLYSFFNHSCPKQQYGRVDLQQIESTGYELIREGMKVLEEEVGKTCNRETIAKSKLTKLMTITSEDFELNTEIIGTSELMNSGDFFTLAMEMPPKVDGCPWVLKFSTAKDGFTLNSLVRKLSDVTSPVLILIQACANKSDDKIDKSANISSIFGAFLSDAPKKSEHFEGTGQTFVFELKPTFNVYKWTGENTYFFKVDNDCMIIGSSKGSNAIWVDADLYQGRTRACGTFDNPSLMKGEDFTLKTLECWAFET